MNRSLAGKTAVVTGAGRGIGRGIASVLAARGATVAVTSLHFENALKVTAEIEGQGGRAVALECDVNEESSIDEMVADVCSQFGSVDILANNAQGSMGTGESGSKPIEKMSAEDMYAEFRGGVLASLWAMQAVFPSMSDRRNGRIINTSSLNGQVGRAQTAHYNAAKEGVRAITRTAAKSGLASVSP